MKYSIILALLVMSSSVHGQQKYHSFCQDQTPDNHHDTTKMTGFWYVYAGNEECKHCCIVYHGDLIGPDTINATKWIQTSIDGKVTVLSGIVKMSDSPGIAYIDVEEAPLICISSDNKNYVACYTESGTTRLYVSTKTAEVSPELEKIIFDKVAQCEMKIYKYHPEITCAKLREQGYFQ